MKKITNFIINDSDLAKSGSIRYFSVNGEVDAEFSIKVFDSSGKFYNFQSKSFETGFISTSNLQVNMRSNVYNGSINFPINVSGDTYTILLLTPPDKDTELSFSSGKHSYITTITQLANAILTFTPRSDGASSVNDHYESQPTTTSTESSVSPTAVTKAISWDVLNKKSDGQGYGLRLIRQPLDTDWYFETTETANGTVASDSNLVVVDDLTDLAIGMELTYITGTTAPGAATIILDIDTETKTLTLSRDQAITDNNIMTFRAYGSSIIQSAIGVNINFSKWNSTVETVTLSKQFTKRVRATGTNAVIALDNTYGISGGSHLRVKGLNVNNLTTNKVVNVLNADWDGGGGDGTITVRLNQTAALSVGTVLKFFGSGLGKGSRDQLKINNSVTINSHPPTNRTIYLDLDNFITIGTNA